VHLDDYIVIAKVGKAHGLKGEFYIHFFGDKVEHIHHFSTFYRKEKASFVTLPKMTFKISGQKIITKMEGINNRDSVLNILNLDIFIKKADLPSIEEDEYYHVDLIGCHCFYKDKEFGIVQDIVDYGSCDIFVIEDFEQQIWHIPFLNNKVDKILIKEKLIYFKDLEGFF
jgi:16S rRNA processing protein RimM